MENLNNQLKNGICPPQLCYNLESSCVDFSKLQYNSRYHSYDFYPKKFPRNWSNEPLFMPIITEIANAAKNKNLAPVQELDELNKISNKYIDEPNPLE